MLCQKPHEKRAIRREIAISVKVSKMAIFRKTAKRGPREIFQNGRFFRQTLQGQKNRKYKPYDSLISMDGKLNYCRVVLCKKPHEKRAIRKEIAISVKVSKMAIFRKTAKGGGKFFKNGRFFRQTLQGQKNRKYKPYDSLISMD